MERKNKIKKSKHMVKLMREIREEMSIKIMDMTYEEERAYLDKLLSTTEVNEKALPPTKARGGRPKASGPNEVKLS